MSDVARRNFATLQAAAESAVNFASLTKRVTALTRSASRMKEQMHVLIAETERNAARARSLAEMCDAAEVEPQYTALIREASTALYRVAESARGVTETADRTELHSQQLGDAHESEYRGVFEAVRASRVRQPKAGFNATR